jgi:lipopolysaccharide export system protein LptA
MAGRIERMVAHGAVEVTQPGRTGTGEQLVYTANDQTFVLTGTKAVPPKLVDDTEGTTTGAALRFRSGDHSVVVSGDAAGQKVRSETQVKQ